MASTTSATTDAVAQVVASVLGIEDRAAGLDASTRLLGSMPELDSMAVLELITALESRFGITVTDEEVTGEVFETLGGLAAFVDSKRPDRETSCG